MVNSASTLSGLQDRCTALLTSVLNRIIPPIPVLTKWPGFKVVFQALYRRSAGPMLTRLRIKAAIYRRRTLSRTTVIGITGSAGKTTTKEILSTILCRRFRVGKTVGSRNYPKDVVSLMLAMSRSTEICLVELATETPGTIDLPVQVAIPDVAIVTTIGSDHLSAFHSLEAIAKEKTKVVESISSEGTAILNADDELVIAMRESCRGKIFTYGCSKEAMLRAENVTCSWPSHLSFTAVLGSERVEVHTRLLGAYWTVPVLAALAAAVTMGMSLAESAAAVADFSPSDGRMNEVVVDGITFIRDDWKASVWTVPAALEFMGAAIAKRKIVVIGTISDITGTSGTAYVRTAKRALQVADHVLFVGSRSSAALRAKVSDHERLLCFSTVKAANAYLKDFLQRGDLVLLKGSTPCDHLLRLILARTGQISCWSSDCRRRIFCDTCASRLNAAEEKATMPEAVSMSDQAVKASGGVLRAVVGLGNPGPQYQGTPHNIGYAVIDRLAQSLMVSWTRHGDAAVGTADVNGNSTLIIKPNVYVNLTGPAVKNLADQFGFRPCDCILLHDDTDLPLGTIRARMRGSDGGHRGVRSVLECFQTDQFPRVKVGVRIPEMTDPPQEFVLKPFPQSVETTVNRACDEAADRVLWFLREGIPNRQRQTAAKA